MDSQITAHTQTHLQTHTQTYTLRLIPTVSVGTAQPPSWRHPGLCWLQPGEAGLGPLTCHGRGLPAGEAALSRAQPPLLTGAVQLWTWSEGTFYFPILEESQGSGASEGSSQALGHLRTKEEAGSCHHPPKSDKKNLQGAGEAGRASPSLGAGARLGRGWGVLGMCRLFVWRVPCGPSCSRQRLFPSFLQNGFCAGSLLSLLSTVTMQPENFPTHRPHHIAPSLKTLPQLCQVQNPQPGWQSLLQLSLPPPPLK